MVKNILEERRKKTLKLVKIYSIFNVFINQKIKYNTLTNRIIVRNYFIS